MRSYTPVSEPPESIAEVGARIWLVDDSAQQAEYSRRHLARRHDVVVFHDAAPMLERLSTGTCPMCQVWRHAASCER